MTVIACADTCLRDMAITSHYKEHLSSNEAHAKYSVHATKYVTNAADVAKAAVTTQNRSIILLRRLLQLRYVRCVAYVTDWTRHPLSLSTIGGHGSIMLPCRRSVRLSVKSSLRYPIVFDDSFLSDICQSSVFLWRKEKFFPRPQTYWSPMSPHKACVAHWRIRQRSAKRGFQTTQRTQQMQRNNWFYPCILLRNCLALSVHLATTVHGDSVV